MTGNTAEAAPASCHEPPRRAIWTLLALVCLGAAVPRAWEIWSQGVEDHDGANLTLESQLVVTVVDAVGRKVTRREGELPKLDQLRGRPMTYAKPLYTLSLLPGWLVGLPRELIGPIFSALWSVATVVVVFALGRALWDPLVGLMAAAIYGASGYSALYARSASAESFGFFCLAIALYAYARIYVSDATRRPKLAALLVGVAWSAAILANYKLFLYAALVLSAGESVALATRGRTVVRRSVFIALGLFGTLLGTQLAFELAVMAWRRIGGEFNALTYWEQLRFIIFEKRGVEERFQVNVASNLGNFARYWWAAEGLVLPLLAAVGLVWAMLRPRLAATVAAPLAVATLAAGCLWSMQSFTVPRAMAALVVPLAPFAGWSLAQVARRWQFERSRLGAVIFCAGYALLLATMVWRIGPDWFRMPSAFRGLPSAVVEAGDSPLFAHWRVKPQTALYVTDRPILQVNDGRDEGEYSLSNLPAAGLLVAPSDYVARHYPDAEVLARFGLRQQQSELALAEDLFSWNASVARHAEDVALLLVRITGPGRAD